MKNVLQNLHRRYLPRKLKWYYRDACSRCRRLTSAPRGGPQFLIIGAQKSGTTYLFSLLGGSPYVISPAFKELHYFDMNYAKPLAWYASFFPTHRRMQETASQLGGQVITGEASPYYMYHPFAAERAHRQYPAAKIIAVLRPPVDRAISHYFHSRNWGHERLPLLEALDAEPARLAAELPRFKANPYYVGKSHPHHSYVDRGHYAEQLMRWEERYGRENMLIIDSRELFADPQSTLDGACRFLGIPRFDVAIAGVKNESTKRGAVPQAVRDALSAEFVESNNALAGYAGIMF